MIWFAAVAVAAVLARILYPRWIEARESASRAIGADGIVVGGGPIDLPRAGASAVLVLHGGGDTTQSVRALAESLHARGYAVRAPLLAGHGREVAAIRTWHVAEWHAQVRREFDALRAAHQRIAIVGVSTGAALALHLLASGATVDSLVLLAPLVTPLPYVRRLAKTSWAWGWAIPYLISRDPRSIHDPVARAQTLGRGIHTPAGIRALVAAADAAAAALPRVTPPTLVVQSLEDNRIARNDTERAFTVLAAKEKVMVWTTGAGHVIAVDYGHEDVFRRAGAWIDAHRRS